MNSQKQLLKYMNDIAFNKEILEMTDEEFINFYISLFPPEGRTLITDLFERAVIFDFAECYTASKEDSERFREEATEEYSAEKKIKNILKTKIEENVDNIPQMKLLYSMLKIIYHNPHLTRKYIECRGDVLLH